MPYNASLVRGLREKKGWNQTELAFRAGVGTTVISDFENYKRQTPNMAKKIARALRVKVDDLWISDDKAELQRGSNGHRK